MVHQLVVCMQSSQTSNHNIVSYQLKSGLQPMDKIQFVNKHIANFHVIAAKKCYIHNMLLLFIC